MKKSNYRILDLVGTGQFGRVFAAIAKKEGTLVALKELDAKRLSTSSFLRELTFLVTLDHFNIVTCQALEHRDDSRYVVMEYCEGGTLRSLLNHSDSLPWSQSLLLALDVLSGLEYAHSKGIIHRDIKPENILLKSSNRGGDRQYTAHIADFGIAKLAGEIAEGNVLGNTGSPAYMAPEQFYGEYSYNCDLYGLGIILYELIVGQRPFMGMPQELLAAHLSQPVSIDSNIPLLLRSAIAKSLAKLPQHRFQTATQMRESLQLILEILESDPQPAVAISSKKGKKNTALAPQTELELASPVSHLAIASDLVYLAMGDRLLVRNYEAKSLSGEIPEIVLGQPIQSLQLGSTGCLIATISSLFYLSPDLNIKLLATFDCDQLITTIEPKGRWFCVAYTHRQSNLPHLEIYQLGQAEKKSSLKLQKPWQSLIALDRQHYLGIYPIQSQNTEFCLFDRRGNWLGNFTVEILLDSIVHNALFPDRLLATEIANPDEVVLITLKQFSLRRIKLGFTPHCIVACPQGYLISDRQGQLILLDHDGYCLGEFQLLLTEDSTITAIAVANSQLLVAVTSKSRSWLQQFAWTKDLFTADGGDLESEMLSEMTN
ncbi:MAG: serine/threonine-protein kinase [Cyanobacteria bacterium J06582_2]